MDVYRSDGLRLKIKSIIWFQVYIISIFGFLRDFIGLPGTVTYLFDVITFGLFLISCINVRVFNIHSRMYKKVLLLLIAFAFVAFLGYALHDYSFLLYLWGGRNTFRFYFFFLICAMYFDETDIKKMNSFIFVLLYVNVLTSTFELLKGYSGDFIGGTFGVTKGGNSYLNIFIVMAICICVSEYLQKKRSFFRMVFVIGLSLYLMAIAELKVLVVELPLIVLISMINERFSFRKILIFMFVLVSIIVGIELMGHFFSGSGVDFFTSDVIFTYMGDKGYTGSGDLNRLNAIPKIKEMFFNNNIKDQLLGFGLGSCSYSGYDFLTSNFYLQYNWLHYQWFTDAIVYIEMGTIGLVIYELFFIYIARCCKKIYKKTNNKSVDNIMLKSVVSFSICSILMSVYNSSMLMECGYIGYMFLAIPLIIDKKQIDGGK